MPQPVNALIRIAESDINTPSTGLPNKKEPTSVLQTTGYDKDQIVAGNHLNYIFDNLADYIDWLQEQHDTLATYIDTQDAVTLTAANTHSDTQDGVTLTSANTYTDTQDGVTLTTANTYTDAQDVINLASANTYTDNEIVTAINARDLVTLSAPTVVKAFGAVSASQNITISGGTAPEGSLVLLNYRAKAIGETAEAYTLLHHGGTADITSNDQCNIYTQHIDAGSNTFASSGQIVCKVVGGVVKLSKLGGALDMSIAVAGYYPQ